MDVSNVPAGSFLYVYDENGNLIQEISPTADPIYEYDARNRLTSVTGLDPDGAGELEAPVTSYTFDLAGNMTSVTDPLGQVTSYEYDAQNRLISVTGPDPDGEGELEAPVTSYTFDLAGRTTSITDPVGNVTSYDYDDANRLVSVTDPLANETTYEYDAANQVIGITDRNGRTRTFTFSALGLMTSEVWLDEYSQPVRTISWTYDNNGRVLTAGDEDSSYTYTYEIGGQVTSIDNDGTPNVPNVVLSFTYDIADNHRIGVADNQGGAIGYGYVDDRLSSLTLSGMGASAQVAFTYDDIGRLITADRSIPGSSDPTIRTRYSYDLADRLLDIKHSNGTGENDPVLSQFSYTYDVANHLTSYTGPEGTLDYEYDHTGQLIAVSGARTESYSFDVNGNRTMSGYETAAGNRLTTDGVYDYTYDNEGNMLTKTRISDGELTEYTWDYRNRLTRIVVKDAQENVVKEGRYTYDVFDRRIGVWEDADGAGSGAAVQRWTAYDGANPWADFDENGSLITRYLYGPEIDELWARMGNGEVDWYLTDYLGSVRQLVHSDATILDAIDYDSFGQIVTETHPENGDRFTYTSREFDRLFGQYYYRERYYGADIGRFYSEDPLGFGGGDTNLYRYVTNSPTNLTDPSGLDWVPTLGGRTWVETSPPPPPASPLPSVRGPGYWVPTLGDRTWVETPPPPPPPPPLPPIGQPPGFGESLIPVWGNYWTARYYIDNEQWGWATIHGTLAITDVLLVRWAASTTWRLGSRLFAGRACGVAPAGNAGRALTPIQREAADVAREIQQARNMLDAAESKLRIAQRMGLGERQVQVIEYWEQRIQDLLLVLEALGY